MPALIASGNVSPAMARIPYWRALRIFNFYQIILGALLLTLSGYTQVRGLGDMHRELFLWTALGYVFLALLCGLLCRRRGSHVTPAVGLIGLDLLTMFLLMHASGGITSGLGVLMISPVAAAGLLLSGRLAMFFAALGALFLLLDQAYNLLYQTYITTAFTQTGLLGAALFATVLVANALSRRTLESEALAERRGEEIVGLSALNQHIVEQMPSGILVVDGRDTIQLINKSAVDLLGLPSPGAGQARTLEQLAPPLHRALTHWQRLAREHELQSLELKDGRILEARFTQIGELREPAVLIQIEDSIEVERRLQASKLASLGRLSASIAHEIRNPLGAISHAAQLLAESQGLGTTERRLAGIIHEQGRRMNTVIANVLGIYRREPAAPISIDLSPWLAQILREYRQERAVREQQLRLHLDVPDASVEMDPTHLRQVLVNLLNNAFTHGVRGDMPPQVDLRVGCRDTAPRGLWLSVCDDGPGMPPGRVAHLFEPFSNTSGKGSGLGLYLARELCELNGARLDFLPNPPSGCCFRVQFGPQLTRHP